MKIKELRKLPFRECNEPKEYEELYVISSGKKHDSGISIPAWCD